jgi:hypothetical protein
MKRDNVEVNKKIGAFMFRETISLRVQSYLTGPVHRSIMLVLTLCNILILSLYGSGEKIRVLGSGTKRDAFDFEFILDVSSVVFLCLGFIEIIVRILAFGWRDFWYVNDDFFQQAANRFDFKVNCATIFLVLFALLQKAALGQSLWFEPWRQRSITAPVANDWTRLFLAIPLLRAFSTIHLIRDVVMGLLTVAPLYAHAFTLLAVLVYVYASLGCLLFSSDLKWVQNQEHQEANFNSMLDAVLTLLPKGDGEWGVWEPLLSGKKSQRVTAYFVSYTILTSMLFYNLLIGVVCDGYQVISELAKQKRGREKVSVKEITQGLREGYSREVKLLEIKYAASGIVLVRQNSH